VSGVSLYIAVNYGVVKGQSHENYLPIFGPIAKLIYLKTTSDKHNLKKCKKGSRTTRKQILRHVTGIEGGGRGGITMFEEQYNFSCSYEVILFQDQLRDTFSPQPWKVGIC
jgi:hypothetical protein